MTVLVASSVPWLAAAWSSAFRAHGARVIRAATALQIVRVLNNWESNPIRIALVDARLPDNGLYDGLIFSRGYFQCGEIAVGLALAGEFSRVSPQPYVMIVAPDQHPATVEELVVNLMAGVAVQQLSREYQGDCAREGD